MHLLSKTEKKILIAVLSILLVLCTMAYFSHRNSQRLISSAEAIEESEEIKFHIKEVLSVSVDMETGIRGYVLTGNEKYLEPANQGMASIFVHLDHLRSAPGITPEQLQRVKLLTELTNRKISVSTATIELRRQKGMQQAVALLAKGDEKKMMDEIRKVAGGMLLDEDAHLGQLKKENISVISHFALAFYLLLLKIAVTVISVVLLLIFYFRNRRRSEQELKESKELFQNVLDHTASAISIKDLSGRFILINHAYQSLFFLQKDKIKGKTIHDLFPKEVADNIRNTDMEVIRLQQQMKIEENMPRLGEMRHYISLKFPLFDINRIPYAICSISTDETEKMRGESEYKEQMSRILDLFNNAPCGYHASDRDGIIIEMNDTELRWLGYTREEVIGKMAVRNIVSEESLEQFAYYFPRLRTGEIKSIFGLEGTFISKHGTKIPVVYNSVSQFDERGNFLYSRTSIYDASFRKKVEELVTHN